MLTIDASETLDSLKLCELGKAVIASEATTIQALIHQIDEGFAHAVEIMHKCIGRIVVIGMGKSGHIGGKIAATLSSTGSPALFVHPGEAQHGDFGMITRQDVVLAISNSGQTAEIISLIPLIEYLQIPLISLTGNPNSTLAKKATVNINIGVAEEACPLGLAPTSSTTATLVMGDALALTLLQSKGFTAQDYARVHPGGMLGRRLLLKIKDIMRTGPDLPIVRENAILQDALVEMTQKSLGMTTVLSEDGTLLGVYTDGDLRRTINKGLNISTTIIKDVMTLNCKTIRTDTLAAEALVTMENHKITSLIVVDENYRLMGVAHMHDLLNAGLR